MGLFSKKPAPGEDAPLADHLADIRAGRERGLPGLVNALAARPLYVGVRELPPGAVPGQLWTVPAPTTVQMMTTELPNGAAPALQVFSSEDMVRARNPAAFPMGQPGRLVLLDVIDHYAGLVLDTAGPTPQALTSEWISQYLRSA